MTQQQRGSSLTTISLLQGVGFRLRLKTAQAGKCWSGPNRAMQHMEFWVVTTRIFGPLHFKVVGAEIDSRLELVKEGAILCGAPTDKRMAMASVASLAASWPYTSDSLHSNLVG